MSEQAIEQPNNEHEQQAQPQAEKPMPPPPSDDIDPDALELAAERWKACPLKDCKRKPELLYEEFYLRDIRTERVMCSACVVQTEIGYQAREVVRGFDDRFYTGTNLDYAIVLAVTTLSSVFVNLFLNAIGFWILAIFIGGAAGAAIGQLARNLTGKRVGRHSAYFAVGGIILGGLLALYVPSIYNAFRFFGSANAMTILSSPNFWLGRLFNLSVILGTVTMASAVWSIFLRRI